MMKRREWLLVVTVVLSSGIMAWAGRRLAAETYSPAATLRRYNVEPTAAGVVGVLRRWQPDAGNGAQIAQLVGQLGNDNWAVREAASRQLAGMGSLAEVALREAMEHSRDAEVVMRARGLLAECRQGCAEELLSAALEWLRQSPTSQATPLLLDFVPVLPDAFQPATREALWVCAGPDDVSRLRQAMAHARPAVRCALIPALEGAAGASAVAELEPLLRDKDEAIRLAAARALLDRLPRPSISALLGLLDAPQPDVCQQAAWLLQQVSRIPGFAEPATDFAAATARWHAWAKTEAAAHPQPLGLNRLLARNYAQYPFVPGKLGNALVFNGSDCYLDFGNPPDKHLDIGENATIEAWVRFDALPAGLPATIVGRNEGSNNRNKWIFGYAIGHQGVANATVFHINSPSTGPISLQSKPWTPVIGQWYHLAVVKSGSQYTFFRNGVADGTDSTTAAVPHVNYAMLMGQSEGACQLQGALDDVRMWNTDLTGDQIHARMNTELTGGEAGLAGYWTMNGSSGIIATDSTRYRTNGMYKGSVGAGR